MRSSILLVGLAAAGAWLVAPSAPAFADREAQTVESYKGARSYARQRARKVQRQERGYRVSERKRLARVSKRARWRYDSPWGPFYGPPGLF